MRPREDGRVRTAGQSRNAPTQQRKREVVVVTGASAGVGRAVAREFAQHGARVGLIARGEDGLEGACRDVESCGGEALAYAADVAEPDADRSGSAEPSRRSSGPIDIWVNDAMTSRILAGQGDDRRTSSAASPKSRTSATSTAP